jgi:hypothetical protein
MAQLFRRAVVKVTLTFPPLPNPSAAIPGGAIPDAIPDIDLFLGRLQDLTTCLLALGATLLNYWMGSVNLLLEFEPKQDEDTIKTNVTKAISDTFEGTKVVVEVLALGDEHLCRESQQAAEHLDQGPQTTAAEQGGMPSPSQAYKATMAAFDDCMKRADYDRETFTTAVTASEHFAFEGLLDKFIRMYAIFEGFMQELCDEVRTRTGDKVDKDDLKSLMTCSSQLCIQHRGKAGSTTYNISTRKHADANSCLTWQDWYYFASGVRNVLAHGTSKRTLGEDELCALQDTLSLKTHSRNGCRKKAFRIPMRSTQTCSPCFIGSTSTVHFSNHRSKSHRQNSSSFLMTCSTISVFCEHFASRCN